MTSEDQKKKEKTAVSTRSIDFRYIPTDALRIAVSEHGVKLIFCMDEEDNTVLEMVGVHMGLHTAAMLRNALIEGVRHHEKQTGSKVEPTLQDLDEDIL